MRPLDNAEWGFESNCFVCERSNDRGLRIPFVHDEDRDVVTADFTLDAAFSGAPRYAHGGIVLAILDEAMAWATIAIHHQFAVTRDTWARFERPVRLDAAYRVEVSVTASEGENITTSAVVSDHRGRTCVHAAIVRS